MYSYPKKNKFMKVIALLLVITFSFQQLGFAEDVKGRRDLREEDDISAIDVIITVVTAYFAGAGISQSWSLGELLLRVYGIPLAAGAIVDELGIDNKYVAAGLKAGLAVGANAGLDALGEAASGASQTNTGGEGGSGGEEGAAKAGSEAANSASSATQGTSGLSSAASAAKTAGQSFLSSMWSGIKSIFTSGGLKALYNSIKDAIWGMIKSTGLAIWELGKGAWNALKSLGEGIFNAGTSLYNGVVSGNIMGGIWSAAVELGEGIWGAVTSLGSGIKGAITNLAGGAGKDDSKFWTAFWRKGIQGALYGAAKAWIADALERSGVSKGWSNLISYFSALGVSEGWDLLMGKLTGTVFKAKGDKLVAEDLSGDELTARLDQQLGAFLNRMAISLPAAVGEAILVNSGKAGEGMLLSTIVQAVGRYLSGPHAELTKEEKEKDAETLKKEREERTKNRSPGETLTKEEREKEEVLFKLEERQMKASELEQAQNETDRARLQGQLAQMDFELMQATRSFGGQMLDALILGGLSYGLRELARSSKYADSEAQGTILNFYITGFIKAGLIFFGNPLFEHPDGARLADSSDNQTSDKKVKLVDKSIGAFFGVLDNVILDSLGKATTDAASVGLYKPETDPASGKITGVSLTSPYDSFFIARYDDVVQNIDYTKLENVISMIGLQMLGSLHNQSVENLQQSLYDIGHKAGVFSASPLEKAYVFTFRSPFSTYKKFAEETSRRLEEAYNRLEKAYKKQSPKKDEKGKDEFDRLIDDNMTVTNKGGPSGIWGLITTYVNSTLNDYDADLTSAFEGKRDELLVQMATEGEDSLKKDGRYELLLALDDYIHARVQQRMGYEQPAHYGRMMVLRASYDLSQMNSGRVDQETITEATQALSKNKILNAQAKKAANDFKDASDAKTKAEAEEFAKDFADYWNSEVPQKTDAEAEKFAQEFADYWNSEIKDAKAADMEQMLKMYIDVSEILGMPVSKEKIDSYTKEIQDWKEKNTNFVPEEAVKGAKDYYKNLNAVSAQEVQGAKDYYINLNSVTKEAVDAVRINYLGSSLKGIDVYEDLSGNRWVIGVGEAPAPVAQSPQQPQEPQQFLMLYLDIGRGVAYAAPSEQDTKNLVDMAVANINKTGMKCVKILINVNTDYRGDKKVNEKLAGKIKSSMEALASMIAQATGLDPSEVQTTVVLNQDKSAGADPQKLAQQRKTGMVFVNEDNTQGTTSVLTIEAKPGIKYLNFVAKKGESLFSIAKRIKEEYYPNTDVSFDAVAQIARYLVESGQIDNPNKIIAGKVYRVPIENNQDFEFNVRQDGNVKPLNRDQTPATSPQPQNNKQSEGGTKMGPEVPFSIEGTFVGPMSSVAPTQKAINEQNNAKVVDNPPGQSVQYSGTDGDKAWARSKAGSLEPNGIKTQPSNQDSQIEREQAQLAESKVESVDRNQDIGITKPSLDNAIQKEIAVAELTKEQEMIVSAVREDVKKHAGLQKDAMYKVNFQDDATNESIKNYLIESGIPKDNIVVTKDGPNGLIMSPAMDGGFPFDVLMSRGRPTSTNTEVNTTPPKGSDKSVEPSKSSAPSSKTERLSEDKQKFLAQVFQDVEDFYKNPEWIKKEKFKINFGDKEVNNRVKEFLVNEKKVPEGNVEVTEEGAPGLIVDNILPFNAGVLSHDRLRYGDNAESVAQEKHNAYLAEKGENGNLVELGKRLPSEALPETEARKFINQVYKDIESHGGLDKTAMYKVNFGDDLTNANVVTLLRDSGVSKDNIVVTKDGPNGLIMSPAMDGGFPFDVLMSRGRPTSTNTESNTAPPQPPKQDKIQTKPLEQNLPKEREQSPLLTRPKESSNDLRVPTSKGIPEPIVSDNLAKVLAKTQEGTYFEVPPNLAGNDYPEKLIEAVHSEHPGAVVVEVHFDAPGSNNGDDAVRLITATPAGKDENGEPVYNTVVSSFGKNPTIQKNYLAANLVAHNDAAVLEFANADSSFTPDQFDTRMDEARDLVRKQFGDRPVVFVAGHGGENYQTSHYIKRIGGGSSTGTLITPKTAEAISSSITKTSLQQIAH